jgi:putative intracellular protease/amidase
VIHAQILLYDGFDSLDVIAPYEVLAAGSDAVGGELVVDLVAPTGHGRWSAAPAASC